MISGWRYGLLLALLISGTACHGAVDLLRRPSTAFCQKHLRDVHSASDPQARYVAMQSELQSFTRLAEESLAMRARAISMYSVLENKIRRGEPFSGSDLQRLNDGAAELLAQRITLIRIAQEHECWLDARVPADPREASMRAAGIGMSLSAALLLYDNYATAISLYRDNDTLRTRLNQADNLSARRVGELNTIAESFTSADRRWRVRRAITWYEKQGHTQMDPGMEGSSYVAQLIEQSPSRNMVRQFDPLHYVKRHVKSFSLITLDSFRGTGQEGSYLSSMLFGNVVGLVEMRHGKLFERPDVRTEVIQTLHAGDILLEKTPFRLTDNFIPGHWGHAAIWVGSERELRQLGIWDHPLVRARQQEIRDGRGVVEALRSGVEMNTARHFLNVDDLAVLRHEALPDEERAKVILQALEHVGKPYDFNFDVQSTDRIFCSKLVYLAYGDLNWPTSRMLGRATISPDNIAQRAIGDGPLAVALLYHDGTEVPQPQARHEMEQLLQAGTQQAAAPRLSLGRN